MNTATPQQVIYLIVVAPIPPVYTGYYLTENLTNR